MPGKVKVKIIAGRNLPVMDRSSDTTDAYVEIKLGNTTYKTDVCRKSLNPQWNSEWYRFEVDDSELQDEPLQIRLMDHDTYSANDAIGKVYLNLNPLLIPTVALPSKYGWSGETNVDQPSSSVMSGWIPVYDTMHGIRGEVNVTVKVELFSDFNKFRQSSCGVQFFCSPVIPHGYHAQVIHGFIEELVVNDDPEYQWIDKIRTPRASNEARQTLFFKLSGELQRKIGVKALDLGGNAVIGYNQCFDLEGESGIVARGIGTVVTLVKHHEMQQQLDIGIAEEKALSYLRFLAFDNGLKLENDNIFERFELSLPNNSLAYPIFPYDNQKDSLTRISPRMHIPVILRQNSQPVFEGEFLAPNLKTCSSSRSLTDDIKKDMAQKLLQQEDMRGVANSGLSQKIKYLKQNVLSKKITALKSKIPDTIPQEPLGLACKSLANKEETGVIQSSLIDLRELRKKKKSQNSSYMAELLVKSVIQAHTSLDCIAECHDSIPTLLSSSLSNEESGESSSHQSIESQNTVLEYDPISGLIKKTISEPYLLLPDTTVVTGSNASSLSDLSSSDGSDTLSEIKDEKSEFDTVSLIVKNVQNEKNQPFQESNKDLHFSYVAPLSINLNSNELQSLSVKEENKIGDLFSSHVLNNSLISDSAPVLQNENVFIFPRSKGKLTKTLSKSCTDLLLPSEIRINVENSDPLKLTSNVKNKIENLRYSALFKSIVERNNLKKSLSVSCEDILTDENFENSYIENKKVNLRDEVSKPNVNKIRGKLTRTFSISCEDISDNINNNNLVIPIDIERKINILKHSALFNNSVEYMQPRYKRKMNRELSKSCTDISSIDNINVNAENSNLTFPKCIENKIEKLTHSALFNMNEKTESRNKNKMKRALSKSCTDIASTDKYKCNIENNNIIKTAIHLFEKVNTNSHKQKIKYHSKSNPELNKIPLIKTAMQTILMEKIDLLTSQNPPISQKVNDEFKKHILKSFSISDPDLRYNFIEKTVNTENIHLFPVKLPSFLQRFKTIKIKNIKQTSRSDPDLRNYNSVKSFKTDKSDITLNKRKETQIDRSTINILLPETPSMSHVNETEKKEYSYSSNLDDQDDKVNILTPNSPVSTKTEDDFIFSDTIAKHDHAKLDKVKHTVHTVLDKIHILSPKSPTSHDENIENQSIMKTAMQTMLLDKVNILAPNSPISVTNEEEFVFHINKPCKDDFGTDSENENLTRTAMETMLIDKVNILTPTSVSVRNDESDHLEHMSVSPTKHDHPNLDKVKSAIHTVLDKVHVLSPKSPTSPTIEQAFNFNIDTKRSSLENQSLTKTAMQTMLMDKVNIIAPNSPISSQGNEFTFEHEDKKIPMEDMSVVNEEEMQNLENVNNILHPASNNSSTSQINKEKKHSLFCSFKRKCKSLKINSPKMLFSKLIHTNSKKSKTNDDGLIKSAMNTILIDKANNIQCISTCSKTEPNPQNEIPSSLKTTPKNITSINPSAFPLKANDKANKTNIALIPTCTDEPNIVVKPDNGDNDKTTAVTADDPNYNTNAEHAPCLYTSDRRIVESPIPERESSIRERHGHQRTESTGGKMSQSPARLNAIPCIHRRSSDSDLSITPKGNSLTGSDRSGGAIPGYHHIRSTLLRPTVDNFDMMEYPFLTMAKYPPSFILHLGGAVSARSVKLLERITNIEEPETRDTWWSELRMEIRTHARALNCNAVLGYTESTSICDEVCVLSASGTAAVIAVYNGELSDGVSGLPNLHKPYLPNKDLMTSSLDRTDFERDKNAKHPEATNTNNKITNVTESPEQEVAIEFAASTQTQSPSCRICHNPYSESNISFRINMLYCSLCKMAKVPDVLLATIEMPDGLPITGRGCFLQSYVCRPKRDLKGELNAKEISESLPFLEYELHRLLVNKMKVKAMNTIFGLKVRITIGEKMLVGVATGTAVFLLPLPPPPLPKLIAGNATTEDKRLADMQKLLVDTVKKNKEIYELKDQDISQPSKLLSDTDESDDEKSNLDLTAGNKDSCVLEVDDAEDIEVINLLVEPRPPDGFHVVNTENVPGLEELEIVKNLQMFTQVWRAKIPLHQSASNFGKHFQKLLQSVYFKLRRMIPCALCDLQFRVDLPEPDEIQLTLLGMALGLGDPLKLNKFKRKNLCHLPAKEHSKKSDDELIFSIEDDHIPENSIPVTSQGVLLNPQMPKLRQKSPQRLRVSTKQRHTPIKERHGVDITPLSYVPGGKIERYLGYLNFFFIRETTSIREGGGLSGFVHSFITEVLAIVRAHVTALGGNAMVAYFMTECILYHNAHKNQGQCLINVGGDVVFVSYFTEDN